VSRQKQKINPRVRIPGRYQRRTNQAVQKRTSAVVNTLLRWRNASPSRHQEKQSSHNLFVGQSPGETIEALGQEDSPADHSGIADCKGQISRKLE
jgi:hypothetical protein